ncbi:MULTISPECIES: hypothetical protein [Streptacidiphilus]|uniref:Serine/threonine protein kinase n=1 Tax=Streptacidiphilus cavernicola TaxID=3342716 RepID=A0ABV6UEK6_9ACTN|nr:hypothetical protein [Streptacidiphilus jeojiense]
MLTPGLLLGLAMAVLTLGAGCAVGHVGGTGAGSSRVEVSLVPQGPSTGSDRPGAARSGSGRRASASGAASGQRTAGARPSPGASTGRSAATVSRGTRLSDAATSASAAARSGADSATSAAPAAFLPVGACVATVTGSAGASYSQVDCGSSAASAVVIRRQAAGTPATSCPSGTDFALQITSIGTDAAATTGSKGQVTGVACLRNLHAPHPGDPGGGGGFGIVVGDCMEDTGGGTLRETACDATGADRPDYRVIGLVARNVDCPNGTTAYITVHNPGSPVQVACAVSVRSGR